MPVPSSISDLSTTPSLNSPAGTESPSTVDDYLRTQAAFIKQVDDKATGTVKATDLAATGGSALVGYDGGTVQSVLDNAKPMADYAALRAYAGRATGVRITQAGLAGFFRRDDADTTSADNGGTIIVDGIGRRWKRLFTGAVSVKWFGAAGVADDTAAVRAAVATGKYVDFDDVLCNVTQSIQPVSHQTLFASAGGGIASTVADYAIKAIGANGSAISSVTSPITALTWTITMASPAGLTVGDQIVLHDVVADEYEVNRVQTIISNTVYTTWPITRSFATPADVRVYKMTPVEGVKVKSLKIKNTGTGGGGVRLLYTKDCEVSGCEFNAVKYISYTAEVSIGAVFRENKLSYSGASASGLRVTKACAIQDNHYIDTVTDEAITLYKSNSFAVISGNRVGQYLSGGGSSAGNTILLDQNNYYNVISSNTLCGSATYHIFLYANSSYNTVTGNTIDRANLGAIKVGLNSNGNTIDNNICSNVTDASDQLEGGATTAAIRVKSDCSGNIIGAGNTFNTLAGLAVVDAQTVSGDIARQLKGPAFSAYQSTTQAIPSNAPTKLLFQSEEFDTDGAYDVVNSRFQPTLAGYYQVNANVAAASSATAVNCRILKNGALWKGGGNASGPYAYANGISTLVYLNGTTDYVEAAAVFSVAQNTEVGSVSTWFNGAFVRG